MNDVEIWQIGNTGLRNPERIQEGFKAFAESSFVGKLHGNEQEIAFMKYLNDRGIIHNEKGNDPSGSYARKWRLMFARYGFIYDQYKGQKGYLQDKLGTVDEITPFGESFLKADTFPAVQECFLRALGVEQYEVPGTSDLFSPFRWILAIMLRLEEITGSSEITRIEFALWGQATDPRDNVDDVVSSILDLRARRKVAPAKKKFDRLEIEARGKDYTKKNGNFNDYCDMNMRYLRISGVVQRKGRGLIITPSKHIIAEKMAKTTASEKSLEDELITLTTGAPLPTDDTNVAKEVLKGLESLLNDRHILYDISDLPLNTATEINIARNRLEDLLAKTNEITYAEKQCDQWREIADYMSLLIEGKDKKEYDEDNVIEIPRDEKPAYLEWIMWRAALAIDHMVNQPYEVRGFRLDSDFFPVSAAGGGKGDLYCEFDDFVILTEVTMSTSSRQESMEGEPVRRHVSDAITRYPGRKVYCLFIAIRIDMNTTETFRQGIWYSGNEKQRLDIVPLSLSQFRDFFVEMFESDKVSPKALVDFILSCEQKRDEYESPEWSEFIDRMVRYRIHMLNPAEKRKE